MVKSIRITGTAIIVMISIFLYFGSEEGTIHRSVFALALVLTSVIFIIALIMPSKEIY